MSEDAPERRDTKAPKNPLLWLRRRLFRAFTTGLATLLPTVLTIYLIFLCLDFIQKEFGVPINNWIKVGLTHTETGGWLATKILGVDPALVKPGPVAGEGVRHQHLAKEIEQRYSPVIGFVAGLFLIMLVGWFVAGLLGRQLWKLIERQLLKVPVIKSIYPYAKQITEFLFKDEKKKKDASRFSAVLAVPWPNREIYSVAFMTGGGLKQVSLDMKTRYITVFIPTAPTPITGFVVFVEAERCLKLNITVEEALRLLISGGVILPSGATDNREVQFFKRDRARALASA